MKNHQHSILNHLQTVEDSFHVEVKSMGISEPLPSMPCQSQEIISTEPQWVLERQKSDQSSSSVPVAHRVDTLIKSNIQTAVQVINQFDNTCRSHFNRYYFPRELENDTEPSRQRVDSTNSLSAYVILDEIDYEVKGFAYTGKKILHNRRVEGFKKWIKKRIKVNCKDRKEQKLGGKKKLKKRRSYKGCKIDSTLAIPADPAPIPTAHATIVPSSVAAVDIARNTFTNAKLEDDCNSETKAELGSDDKAYFLDIERKLNKETSVNFEDTHSYETKCEDKIQKQRWDVLVNSVDIDNETKLALAIQQVLIEFKKRSYDVVSFTDIVMKIAEHPPNVDALNLKFIRLALKRLHSMGSILYFDVDEVEKLANSRPNLSQFVILNLKFLDSVVPGILDLLEYQRITEKQENILGHSMKRRFFSLCPLISNDHVVRIWKSKNVVQDAMKKINSDDGFYSYLIDVCEFSGKLIPVSRHCGKSVSSSTEYFIPSLANTEVPKMFWSFQAKEEWKTTLCQSWSLKDHSSDLMNHLTASSLGALLSFTKKDQLIRDPNRNELVKVQLRVVEVQCWKTAFYVELQSKDPCRFVKIFVSVVQKGDPHCAAAKDMSFGEKKLIVSAQGDAQDDGISIWKLGYEIVVENVQKVICNFFDSPVKREVVCPDCFISRKPSSANQWNLQAVLERGNENMICCNGHRVPPSLLSGIDLNQSSDASIDSDYSETTYIDPHKRTVELIPSLVMVALLDEEHNKIISVGSGFVVDRRKGLIITARHIIFDMNGGGIGNKFFGVKKPKIVIGVVKPSSVSKSMKQDSQLAMFQYFAQLVISESCVDACVLRITTKLKKPIGDELAEIAVQPEGIIRSMKPEKLQELKLCEDCQLEERIRCIGFPQDEKVCNEDVLSIDRSVFVSKGYVCKYNPRNRLRQLLTEEVGHRQFIPTFELVAMCSTFQGQSGGPIVNQDGNVIGILSRADSQVKCYIVPSKELKRLLKEAKKKLSVRDKI